VAFSANKAPSCSAEAKRAPGKALSKVAGSGAAESAAGNPGSLKTTRGE
jgi:hypothetical protein